MQEKSDTGIIEGEITPIKYEITSYGADYLVDGLVKRLKTGDIIIPPFQREYVWNIVKASRFIESLLLGLPVPGIFLYREEPTKKLVVIDGNQRLNTLRFFYDGIFYKSGREFTLAGIKSQYKGVTYKSLSEEDRRVLNASIIHATIIKQDKPTNDLSSVFHIFERLNTGGSQLVPQEIRSAIYSGKFNDLLADLNKHRSWRELFGKVNSRMRDQELILRFIALYFENDKYSKPMREFLNTFMGNNRNLKKYSAEQIRKVFTNTANIIAKGIGKRAFGPRRILMASVFDAVMIGVARRLEQGNIKDYERLKEKHGTLMNNSKFQDATEIHTSDEDRIKARIRLAIEAFADVP